MIEEWRGLFDGFYEVSNLGRIRRAKSGSNTYVGKILKFWVRKDNRLGVRFCGNGAHENRQVHQVVAEAFIGPRPRGKEVNHKDGNCQNNMSSNLEYVTHKRNLEHAGQTGLMACGSKHHNAKLSEEKVRKIRELYKLGKYSQSEVGRMFGVSHGIVCNVVNGKAWKHVEASNAA